MELSAAGNSYAGLAARLHEQAGDILSAWEKRIRYEVPASKEHASGALTNTFPDLIASVVLALSPEHMSRVDLRRALGGSLLQSRTHGMQRARETRFTLKQVFFEFRVLRRTILEVLEAGGPVPLAAHELIADALEAAMLEAGEQFALVKQEEQSARAVVAEEAVRETRRLTEGKDQLLATVAHELRTPFSAISNALHVLGQTTVTDPRSVRLLERATRQTRKIARLLEDLLDVSRLIRGQMQLKTETCDLREIGLDAMENLQLATDTEAHEFSTALPEGPVWSVVDAARIEQILVNLLDNAAKYTPEGGRIVLTLEQEADCARFRIRDSGIGIEPGRLNQIFNLFEQIDPDPTTVQKGVGIGLSLVKTLVEMHGGRVRAHSEGLGRGSEFLVQLPCFPGQPNGSPGRD